MKPLSFSNNVKCRPPTGLRSHCLSVCAYLRVTQIGHDHNPSRDFLLLFLLVTNPPIQIITTVSQHRRSDLTEKLSPSCLSETPTQTNFTHLGGGLQEEWSVVPLSKRGQGPAGAGRLEAAQAQRAFSVLGQQVPGGAVVLWALAGR